VNPLESLHIKYNLLLRRRANWLVKSNQLANDLDSENICKKVFTTIEKLQDVAKILLLVMVNA